MPLHLRGMIRLCGPCHLQCRGFGQNTQRFHSRTMPSLMTSPTATTATAAVSSVSGTANAQSVSNSSYHRRGMRFNSADIARLAIGENICLLDDEQHEMQTETAHLQRTQSLDNMHYNSLVGQPGAVEQIGLRRRSNSYSDFSSTAAVSSTCTQQQPMPVEPISDCNITLDTILRHESLRRLFLAHCKRHHNHEIFHFLDLVRRLKSRPRSAQYEYAKMIFTQFIEEKTASREINIDRSTRQAVQDRWRKAQPSLQQNSLSPPPQHFIDSVFDPAYSAVMRDASLDVLPLFLSSSEFRAWIASSQDAASAAPFREKSQK